MTKDALQALINNTAEDKKEIANITSINKHQFDTLKYLNPSK